MADATLTSPDNVLITCNDDVTSDNFNFVAIRKWSTGVVLAKFLESGEVQITGTISRGSSIDINNTAAGNGTILRLQKTGTIRLVVDYTSGTGVTFETPSGTDDPIVLKSASDVAVILDHDNDSGTTNKFRIKDNAGKSRFDVVISSTVEQANLRDANEDLVLSAQYDSANDRMDLDVGGSRSTSNPLRGQIKAWHDGGATTKPGLLVLNDKSGNDWYIWVDTSGVLRIKTTDPGNSDTTGTVVGTQT